MIVTKEGNLELLKKYVKFRCSDCGCEFIADNTEYSYEFNQHDGEVYNVKCPCCKGSHCEAVKKLASLPQKESSCQFYDTRTEIRYLHDLLTGKPTKSYECKVGICLGTREKDECSCGGDPSNCTCK